MAKRINFKEQSNKTKRIIYGLLNFFSSHKYILDDIHLQKSIDTLDISLDFINNFHISRYIQNTLGPLYEKIQESNDETFNNTIIQSTIPFIEDLRIQLKELENETDFNSNSEKYYNKVIHELKTQELALKNILESNQNKTQEQTQLVYETKQKLNAIEQELRNKNIELEKKQKQEDAKNDWTNKINETFSKLELLLNPIKEEHKRLNILYYAYAILTSFTLIIIFTVVIIAIVKISSNDELPKATEYLLLYLPIPIAGALMWGFVFQMNRAQRHLMLISKKIHSVKYIEGLMLSINNLSPDINDGIIRINKILDKIISNHLDEKTITNEENLLKEENKDESPIDLDKVLKIIKAVNETAK